MTTPSRRSVVAATAAAAVGAGGALVPGEAAAAGRRRRKRTYRRTRVPSAPVLHALERFTGGYHPALLAQVQADGGFGRWFDRQLNGGYSDAWYDATSRWWTSLNASDDLVWQRSKDDVEELWRVDANYQCWTLVRRIGSQRQVLETMAAFWEHHLHVPANGEVGPFRASYGKTVRAHALGRFDQLLQATITHPAMSVFLTNANSAKWAPNENLARELLELHTVGRGHYTEDDVKASARLLTGYRIGIWRDWKVSYDPLWHWVGPVRVMDFEHANLLPDGRAAVQTYLRYLAHHPATAQRIARKLAVRFVSDNPSAGLVAHLARVYLAHDTAIKPVLKALVASAEFARSAGRKVRTPDEDVVATWRALGARITAPGSSTDSSAANAVLWQASTIGLRPLGWPRPDGRPDTAAAWSSTSRFLASLEMHYGMAGGWWPKAGAVHPSLSSWLPQRRLRFDQLVDHLSRRILGRPATPLLLQAACQATGCRRGTVITREHALVRWSMPRLLTVLLDSPTHMTR